MSLSIHNLSGGYDDTLVIQDLTGEITSGQIVGVFGRNGVGKTTLARLIIGELQTTSGVISIHDQSVQLMPTHERRKVGIGYLPQNYMVFDNLTVRENLILAGSLDHAEPYFVRFPRLKKRLTQKASTMSGGERKILSFVRSMIENTTCLVLDEPSEGVQPENIKLMQECLLEKKASGVSILLIEQNINMLENLADHYWGIESGKLVYNKHKTVAKHEDIIELLTV